MERMVGIEGSKGENEGESGEIGECRNEKKRVRRDAEVMEGGVTDLYVVRKEQTWGKDKDWCNKEE